MAAPRIYSEYIHFPWRRNQIDAAHRRPRCRLIVLRRAPGNDGAQTTAAIALIPFRNLSGAIFMRSDEIELVVLVIELVRSCLDHRRLIHVAPEYDDCR